MCLNLKFKSNEDQSPLEKWHQLEQNLKADNET